MALVKLDTVLYTVIRKSSSIFARLIGSYQLSFVVNPLMTLCAQGAHLRIDGGPDRQLVNSERRACNVGRFAWHGNRYLHLDV
ncbi:hypothetical protein ACSTTR_002904 [Serratia marcescens]|uniref:hypothetical protein n=1 Tax=Serratia grimesii TaxID=82995 RepID=UPI0021BD1884|nr:hypothetical protein [Serratia grimesii]